MARELGHEDALHEIARHPRAMEMFRHGLELPSERHNAVADAMINILFPGSPIQSAAKELPGGEGPVRAESKFWEGGEEQAPINPIQQPRMPIAQGIAKLGQRGTSAGQRANRRLA